MKKPKRTLCLVSPVYQIIMFIQMSYKFICQLYFDQPGGRGTYLSWLQKESWAADSRILLNIRGPIRFNITARRVSKIWLVVKFFWPTKKKKKNDSIPWSHRLVGSRYFVSLLPDPILRNLIRPRESHTGKECLHLFREMYPKWLKIMTYLERGIQWNGMDW